MSDIERHEAIAVCELLINSNRIDMIVPAFREGATLDAVRQRLAAEATPAAPAARPAASLAEQWEAAAQGRFAAMRKAY